MAGTTKEQEQGWGEEIPYVPPAPAHNFEEQPVFVGTLTGSHPWINEDGQTRIIFDFTDEAGEPRAIFSTVRLGQQLAQVPPGTQVRIEYTGRDKSMKGSPKMFKVQVR